MTFEKRVEISKGEFAVGPTCHLNNGDEANVPNFVGQFHKSLPHDELGQVPRRRRCHDIPLHNIRQHKIRPTLYNKTSPVLCIILIIKYRLSCTPQGLTGRKDIILLK